MRITILLAAITSLVSITAGGATGGYDGNGSNGSNEPQGSREGDDVVGRGIRSERRVEARFRDGQHDVQRLGFARRLRRCQRKRSDEDEGP